MSTKKIDPRRAPPRVPSERPGAVGGVRDANRRRRIAQLCDAALALYLRHGIDAVTIDQIVERAGVAKGSFYRYVTDQAELVTTLLGPLADAVRTAMANAEARLGEARTPAELPAVYLAMAGELAAAATRDPELVRLYLQECRSPAAGARRPVRLLADEVAARAIRLSTVARDFGLLRDADPRVSALAVVGAVERLSFAALTGEDIGRLDDVPREVISMLLDGVRAPAPTPRR